MSVLTKLFVVLLVVTSLLLSASVAVFVNRVEDYKGQAEAAAKKASAKSRDVEDLKKVISEDRSVFAAALQQGNTKATELGGVIVERETAIQEGKAKIAQLEKEAQVATATNKGTTDALKASQGENEGYLKTNTELRTKSDELLKQNGELNTEITVKTNKVDRLEKSNAYLQEQVADLRAQLAAARQSGGVASAKMQSSSGGGGTTDTTVAPAGAINARIVSVDVIGGKKYATISVGSADNVVKGMKFNVVNTQTGEFLGYLTVDSVQPNEAIGQVEGKIEKIQKDVEVKTQL